MAAKRYVSQPTIDDERDLLALVDDEPTEVQIRRRRLRFTSLTGFAQHKLTRILVRPGGNETAISCKCVAAARLNGFFSISLFWPLLWRWYYYIRQYREDELTEAVALIKKKVPLTAYIANTTLLIAMRETMMQMSRAEVFLTLREHSGDNAGSSAKNAHGSPSLSGS